MTHIFEILQIKSNFDLSCSDFSAIEHNIPYTGFFNFQTSLTMLLNLQVLNVLESFQSWRGYAINISLFNYIVMRNVVGNRGN